MGNFLSTGLALLAQNAEADPGGGSMLTTVLFVWVPIGLLFYWLLIAPQRREQKKREEMIRAVKENDRVLVLGGIYGVVTNVQRDSGQDKVRQVTVRVDESNNTKIRVLPGAIAHVLTEEPSGESSSK